LCRPLPSQRNPRLVRPRPPRPPTNHKRINDPSCTQCARLATPSNAHCTRCNSHMTSKCTLHTSAGSPHTSSSHEGTTPHREGHRRQPATTVVANTRCQKHKSREVDAYHAAATVVQPVMCCTSLAVPRGEKQRSCTHTAHTHTHTQTNSCLPKPLRSRLTQNLRIYLKSQRMIP
jgi:hypothetical protein